MTISIIDQIPKPVFSAAAMTGSLYFGARQTIPVSLGCGAISGIMIHLYPENTKKIISAVVGSSVAIGMNQYNKSSSNRLETAVSILAASSAFLLTNSFLDRQQTILDQADISQKKQKEANDEWQML